MSRTYEIPARFLLTTDADLKDIGFLVLSSEISINGIEKIVANINNREITGIVRVHFNMPKEATNNDPSETCSNQSVEH